jgi:hypothetical protein
MKTIKKLKTKELIVDGVLYTPYMIGELPPSFGYKLSTDREAEGKSEWFNYKGLTYLKK